MAFFPLQWHSPNPPSLSSSPPYPDLAQHGNARALLPKALKSKAILINPRRSHHQLPYSHGRYTESLTI